MMNANDTHQIEIQSGLQSYQIQGQGHINIDINAQPRVSGNVFIEMSGTDVELSISANVQESSNVHVVIMNKVDGHFTINKEANVAKDAYYEMGFADLEAVILKANIKVNLLEQGAHTDVLTVSRVSEKKDCIVQVEHRVPFTTSDTRNFAIVNEKGNYKMEAVGEIFKGANGSVCHQSSRVLTTSSNQVSDVLPVLLIDENDVKASHATTVGQPDAEQLYYLQSRGLTHDQALGLLTIGYLLPITEVIEDEELQASLKEYVEMKVGLHV